MHPAAKTAKPGGIWIVPNQDGTWAARLKLLYVEPTNDSQAVFEDERGETVRYFFRDLIDPSNRPAPEEPKRKRKGPSHPATNDQKKLIFVLARQKGLSHDAVREMTPNGSVRAMSTGEASNLINRLKGKRVRESGLITDAQIGQIKSLAHDAGMTDHDVRRFLRNKYRLNGFNDSNFTHEVAQKVMQAFRAIKNNKKSRHSGSGTQQFALATGPDRSPARQNEVRNCGAVPHRCTKGFTSKRFGRGSEKNASRTESLHVIYFAAIEDVAKGNSYPIIIDRNSSQRNSQQFSDNNQETFLRKTLSTSIRNEISQSNFASAHKNTAENNTSVCHSVANEPQPSLHLQFRSDYRALQTNREFRKRKAHSLSVIQLTATRMALEIQKYHARSAGRTWAMACVTVTYISCQTKANAPNEPLISAHRSPKRSLGVAQEDWMPAPRPRLPIARGIRSGQTSSPVNYIDVGCSGLTREKREKNEPRAASNCNRPIVQFPLRLVASICANRNATSPDYARKYCTQPIFPRIRPKC